MNSERSMHKQYICQYDCSHSLFNQQKHRWQNCYYTAALLYFLSHLLGSFRHWAGSIGGEAVPTYPSVGDLPKGSWGEAPQQHARLQGWHPTSLPGGKGTTLKLVPMLVHWLATPGVLVVCGLRKAGHPMLRSMPSPMPNALSDVINKAVACFLLWMVLSMSLVFLHPFPSPSPLPVPRTTTEPISLSMHKQYIFQHVSYHSLLNQQKCCSTDRTAVTNSIHFHISVTLPLI